VRAQAEPGHEKKKNTKKRKEETILSTNSTDPMSHKPDPIPVAMPPKITRHVLVNGVFVDTVEYPDLKATFLQMECPADPPLVSILIWCGTKYPASYLLGLLLSLERQTYSNWEAVIQTDGPREDVRRMLQCEWLTKDRIELHETLEACGWWGFPCKQEGFALCKGQYMVATNDDNYYVPIWLQRMVETAQLGYELVLCDRVNSDGGFCYTVGVPIEGTVDLGCALVKKELVNKVPWPRGNEPTCDGRWIEELSKKANKAAIVRKALFVHC
jgi:hypothetical protein